MYVYTCTITAFSASTVRLLHAGGPAHFTPARALNFQDYSFRGHTRVLIIPILLRPLPIWTVHYIFPCMSHTPHVNIYIYNYTLCIHIDIMLYIRCIISHIYMRICIWTSVCVCVCVKEREGGKEGRRNGEGERQRESELEGGKKRASESESGGREERDHVCVCVCVFMCVCV